jgi:hypothetical protein
MPDLQGQLNLLAGTSNLDAQGAANVWAGTTNLDLLGALNTKNGTWGLGFNGVCRALGLSLGGSGERDANGAMGSIPITGHGGTGMDGTANRYWITAVAGVTNVDTTTTSVSIIAHVAATDWTPAAVRDFGGWSQATAGVIMGLNTAGTLRVRIDQSGAGTTRTVASSVATGFTDSATIGHWVGMKVADAGTSGTCSFYTSGNTLQNHPGYDVTTGGWTILGSANQTITSWDGTYRSVARALSGVVTAGAAGWIGRIYYMAGMIDGIVPDWELNFANEQHGATALTDDRGRSWSATGTGISVVR